VDLRALWRRVPTTFARVPLRWKILVAVAVVPIIMTMAAIGILTRGVTEQAFQEMHEALQRTSLLLENTIAARTEALTVTSDVIVRDPRFFATLSLPGTARDRWYRTTVQDVASDFIEVARTDLFEVLDRNGRVAASVGRDHTTAAGRTDLIESAGKSGRAAGLVVEGDRQYQATLTPIMVHGQRAGTLLLGTDIGASLAHDLQVATQSEVSFVIDGAVTGTTLEPDVLVAAGLADLSAGTADAANPKGMELVRAGSETYLTLVRPLPGAPAGSRHYYVMQRSVDAGILYLRRLQAMMVQLGLAAVIAAFGIGVFVSSRITRPILEVVRGAEEMERGNYDHPIDVHGGDELGYLANRFVTMRRHEQTYVNSLREVARLKSEFISVASHELRTPVSVIRGYHEMFAQGQLGPLTDEQRRVLGVIEEHVNGLARIAENATRVAQIEGERLTLYLGTHDLGRIIEDAASAALAGADGRNVEVMVDVQPGLEAVTVDGPRLLDAVIQLVRNGIRFTPDGGRVEVAASMTPQGVRIDVTDTGIGIAEDALSRLFDRAVTVRDSLRHHSSNTLEFNSAGLGLGLSIVRGIVEAHGSELKVESEIGRGSTFRFVLPSGMLFPAGHGGARRTA